MNTNTKSNEILTTTHDSCNILVDLLREYGVKHAIVSPGSRNAPIIIALSRCDEITKHIIVDERSAAFAAIGIAQQTDTPVAIVCTSGTAVLNYAPAIAEAFYQQLPLIVISADRPHEWIDQNDSQTLKQPGILANIVKQSCNIPAQCFRTDDLWYCNRIINEALQCATNHSAGPVHINIELGEPLYERKPVQQSLARKIEKHSPYISAESLAQHSDIINSHKKVLILASMHPKCQLASILNNISGNNIVVIGEIIANCNSSDRIFHNIDRLFTEIDENLWASLRPDLLITFGGAPVSRLAKTFLRKLNGVEHWRIGCDSGIIDTMQNLTQKINVTPLQFFTNITVKHNDSSYYSQWSDLASKANASLHAYINQCPWSDLKAMSIIMQHIPTSQINIQISNGSSIRYADLLGTPSHYEGSVHCNRGVSGIDGSTSTALGASMVSSCNTLLITGDMSFSYDLGGLASQYNSQRLKIIVLCNGGGGIFRFINGPSQLPQFEDYFEVHQDIPTEKYAHAFGFDHFHATDEESLTSALNQLFASHKPAILSVHTNNMTSADTLRKYYNRNK